MNIPRPLLVIVVVIIVLGVVSCGAAAFHGIQDATATPPPFPTPTPQRLTEGLINAPVQPGDVSLSNPSGGSCSISGPDINITTACRLTVDPQTFRPRKLFLAVASGSTTIVVSQVIRDHLRSSDPDTESSGVFEVSVAGSSPVFVDVGCASCALHVNS